jgi:D-psicose/D-tagatose/L-ribulose 3-epimerase
VLRRVAEKADASGIKVGVEVVNRYETNVVNTAAEVVALIERIGGRTSTPTSTPTT